MSQNAPTDTQAAPTAPNALQDGLVTDVLMLKSPTCGPCRVMGPRVKQWAEDGAVQVVEYDITTPEGADVMQRYGDVRGVPTFIAVDSSGTEVRRHIGLAVREQWDRLTA